MKAFLDTSALFKKYVVEPGSERLDELLKETEDIIIAPVTKIELFSALDRRLQEKSLKPSQAKTIAQEITKDLPFFSAVLWNEALEEKAVGHVQTYHLRALDALQLGAGQLSSCDLFITCDKTLARAAQKELDQVLLL